MSKKERIEKLEKQIKNLKYVIEKIAPDYDIQYYNHVEPSVWPKLVNNIIHSPKVDQRDFNLLLQYLKLHFTTDERKIVKTIKK